MDWMISGTPANPSVQDQTFYLLLPHLPGIGSLSTVCRYRSAASRYIFATTCRVSTTAEIPAIPFKFESSSTGRSGCNGVWSGSREYIGSHERRWLSMMFPRRISSFILRQPFRISCIFQHERVDVSAIPSNTSSGQPMRVSTRRSESSLALRPEVADQKPPPPRYNRR